MNIFRSFFAFMLELHVRCDNQYKTGADRENILGQPMLFVCMGICVLSLAHESEMRVTFLCTDCKKKKKSHRFCLNSATAYKIRRSYRGSFWGFFKTFLEGSVDLIIYRDYIVNRRFFIYCSLATWLEEWGQLLSRRWKFTGITPLSQRKHGKHMVGAMKFSVVSQGPMNRRETERIL